MNIGKNPNGDNNREREIIDLLRSVMYSDEDNLLVEVEALGELLGEYDGVPYEADKNRLTQAVKEMCHMSDALKQEGQRQADYCENLSCQSFGGDTHRREPGSCP